MGSPGLMQPFGLSPLVMKDSLFSGLLKRCVKELMGQVLRQGQRQGSGDH